MKAPSEENLVDPNIYRNFLASTLTLTMLECAHNYSPFLKKKTASSVSIIISIRGLCKRCIKKNHTQVQQLTVCDNLIAFLPSQRSYLLSLIMMP